MSEEIKPYLPKRLKQAVGWFLLIIILMTITRVHIPIIYTAPEIQGTVLDANTEKPIKNVVVVATWPRRISGLFHRRPYRSLWVIETQTDSKGHYTIPAQGTTLVFRGFLSGSDPVVRFFKNGYLPEFFAGANSGIYDSRVRASLLNGRKVFLKKTRYSNRSDIDLLRHFASNLSYELNIGYCDWTKTPHMLNGLNQAAQFMDSKTELLGLSLYDVKYSIDPKEFIHNDQLQCGDLPEILGS